MWPPFPQAIAVVGTVRLHRPAHNLDVPCDIAYVRTPTAWRAASGLLWLVTCLIQDRLMPYLKDAHALKQTSLQMTEAAAKGRAVRSCRIGERRVGAGAAIRVQRATEHHAY
jgi:hypothetical protein